MTITNFEDIEGWQLGRQLTNKIYIAITAHPDFSRDWGLRDQITLAPLKLFSTGLAPLKLFSTGRAAGSIMHNTRPVK